MLEAPAVVTGFDDVGVMREPVEQCHGHRRGAERQAYVKCPEGSYIPTPLAIFPPSSDVFKGKVSSKEIGGG